ncbi:MAG: aconitate hydratase AcnA [Acidimicrobiales bacterium]
MNSFGTIGRLTVDGDDYRIERLDALPDEFRVDRLPYSLKVLLEGLLRHEDGEVVTADDIAALALSAEGGAPEREIAFSPARILLQDFTGVPCIADLAALRDAVASLGGDPGLVNPRIPADLVIDHSLVVDVARRPDASATNARLEFARNGERYRFLRWGQQTFAGLRVVPPDTGICHQVNLELLSKVVTADETGAAFPDTLVGTDSHTTMVNGLGVLGWGVGGIEAVAAMLGQPIPLLIPRVVGLRLDGALPEGATATDLVLTIAELLRSHGVVGKFVECFGSGLAHVPAENRATIGNMSPEYGSTVTIFPIDAETLRYLRFTGRPESTVRLVEAYAKEQGLWHDPAHESAYCETVALDLSTIVPSIAGPARPQDRVPLDRAKEAFAGSLAAAGPKPRPGPPGNRRLPLVLTDGQKAELADGSVVIAAITSCTNTSNPQVMIAAGLLARRAVEHGLAVKSWVKTSLAPGSRVVVDYLDRAGLTPYLEKLGFGVVGFGCTTCIGNSGPLATEVSAAIEAGGLACVAVLSGNRNFEGRIHPEVRMNYLASPPLVVAFALAGTMDVDLYRDPLGSAPDGTPVYLRDLWPTQAEVAAVVEDALDSAMFATDYADVFAGDDNWRSLKVPPGQRFAWDDESTYLRKPPFLDGMSRDPGPVADISGARVLAVLGDSVTTDHISPAGSIDPASPAGKWLVAEGVDPSEFNSYGTRRGNHEVMVRGTFANRRIRNALAGGAEGGVTIHLPDATLGSIYDVANAYRAEGVTLIVLAGREYGSGSSRDWAAKGVALLGVRAVLVESFERIHRSNLIGMGVVPLEYLPGESATTLGLTGTEVFTVNGLTGSTRGGLIGKHVTVRADDKVFEAVVRIDTPTEECYYRHGGILPYIARRLTAS